MKSAMRTLPAILCVIAALLAGGTAQAGLTVTLTAGSEFGNPAADTVFTGVLTNTSGTDKLFLNDVQVTLSGASATHLTLNKNTFFASVPGILLPGESYNGPLFSIGLGALAPVAEYAGSIDFNGGADIQANAQQGTAAFTLRYALAEQWRYQKFGWLAGDALAADTADWDHDGVLNLIEYALATEPKTPTVSSGLLVPALLGSHGTLRYVPNPAATDLTYGVEISSDLTNWSGAGVELLNVANPDPPGSVTWECTSPLAAGAPVFMHLKVTR
jgi:hypothetical protein